MLCRVAILGVFRYTIRLNGGSSLLLYPGQRSYTWLPVTWGARQGRSQELARVGANPPTPPVSRRISATLKSKHGIFSIFFIFSLKILEFFRPPQGGGGRSPQSPPPPGYAPGAR